MQQRAAGCVVTRDAGGELQVLLVHPRRASFRRPLFGIPKGIVEPGENEADAARRETFEETGLVVKLQGDLGEIRQKSGKIVHAFWAVIEPASAAAVDARGRCKPHDDENDWCQFYSIAKARDLMIPAQTEFLDRLIAGEVAPL